jgi:hypothetical protein
LRPGIHSGAIIWACIATLALASAVVVATPTEQNTKYKVIGPELIEQGDEFTAQVVEETDQGDVPLREGDQVSFQGQVLDVQHNGKVRVPGVFKELGNVFVLAEVLRATQGRGGKPERAPMAAQHVEVVPPISSGELVPTKIAHTPEIVTPERPLRVEGQGLKSLERASLVGEDGRQIEFSDSVGSSLQRIYFLDRATTIPKGTYRFVAWDASGNRFEAPTLSHNPRMQIQGQKISRRGQHGEVTITSDTDSTVILSGGQPQITLEESMVQVLANQPKQVKFTANEVGPYTVKARALNPEEIPSSPQAPRVDTRPEPIQARYDPVRNQTVVNAPVRVLDSQGSPLAKVPVDMALSHPKGIEYVRLNTDANGHANFLHTFGGQIAATALSVHVYRVLEHEWKQPPQATPSALQTPAITNLKPGDGISFQVVVNNSTDGVQTAKVQDLVPAGASHLDPRSVRVVGSSTAPNNQSGETTGIYITNITVPPHAAVTISYTFYVGEGVQAGVSLSNAAWVNDRPTNPAQTPAVSNVGTTPDALQSTKKYTGSHPGTVVRPTQTPGIPTISKPPETPTPPTYGPPTPTINVPPKVPCDCQCHMTLQFSAGQPIDVRFASPATDQTLDVPLGGKVPLVVNAVDTDLLTVTCQKLGCGPNPCPPCSSQVVVPLPGTLRYRWELVSGAGELVSTPPYPHRHSAIAIGPASIYKAPDEMPQDTTVSIRLTVEDSPEYLADINDQPFVRLLKFRLVEPGQQFNVPTSPASVGPGQVTGEPTSDCSCQPDLKWDADKPITPESDAQTTFAVGVNDYIVLQAGAKDVDQLTLRCADPKCSSPETVVHLNDALFYRWQPDKGNIIGTSEKVVYRAPGTAGKAKVERWVRDSGVHPGPAHEGEKRLDPLTIDVFKISIIDAGDYIVPTPSNEATTSASLERGRRHRARSLQSFDAALGSRELKLGRSPAPSPVLRLEWNLLGSPRSRLASWNPALSSSRQPSVEPSHQLALQADPQLPLAPPRFQQPPYRGSVLLAMLSQPRGPADQVPTVPGSGANVIRYKLDPSPADDVRLEVYDKDSKLVRTIRGLPKANGTDGSVEFKWNGLDDAGQPLKQEGSPFRLRVVATKRGAETPDERTAQVKSWKFSYRISDRPEGAGGFSGIDVNTVSTDLIETFVQPDGGDDVHVPVYELKKTAKDEDVDVTLKRSYADGDFFFIYTSPTKPNQIKYTIRVHSNPGGALDKAGNEWDMDPKAPGIQRTTTWILYIDENGKVILESEKIK